MTDDFDANETGGRPECELKLPELRRKIALDLAINGLTRAPAAEDLIKDAKEIEAYLRGSE